MNSEEAAKDLEILLDMEIKLRLLDVEGMDLPEEPPPVPREPTNYDFAVETKWPYCCPFFSGLLSSR